MVQCGGDRFGARKSWPASGFAVHAAFLSGRHSLDFRRLVALRPLRAGDPVDQVEWTPRSSLVPPDRVVDLAGEAHARWLLREHDEQVTMLGSGFSRAGLLHPEGGLLLDGTGVRGLLSLGLLPV